MQTLIAEDWLLTDEDEEGMQQPNKLFLIHIGEQHLKASFLSAAVRLSAQDFKGLFPGYLVEFHQHPGPGFCLTPGRGWDGLVNQQTQHLAQKILWETQRLAEHA